MNPRLAKQGLHGPYCCSTAYLLGLMAPYVIAPITIFETQGYETTRWNTLDVGFQVAKSIIRTNLREGGMATMECYVPESTDGRPTQRGWAAETLATRGSRLFWLRSGLRMRCSETQT
jgi:hypothetical protein